MPTKNHVTSMVISLLGFYGNLGMVIFSTHDTQYHQKYENNNT
ncbi:MAG: hypothetical protein ACTS8U_04235 [Arsenophonus sp. ET-DL9-MAG3]